MSAALLEKLKDLFYTAQEKVKTDPRLWAVPALVLGYLLGKVL